MKLGSDRSEYGMGSMAVYRIIHIENEWIVCFEQARLISFDRKWKALKTSAAACPSASSSFRVRRPSCASPEPDNLETRPGIGARFPT